ncbi:MAG: hypothetical protein ACI845_001601 [Gammaproteobacteria bacterium]|jgi:hypothetical protein
MIFFWLLSPDVTRITPAASMIADFSSEINQSMTHRLIKALIIQAISQRFQKTQ